MDRKIYLGNLKAKRDWGFAPEYVQFMWQMLQQEKAEDYVIATGQSYSVEDFLTEAFAYSGLGDWMQYVQMDARYFRPSEVENLIGDSKKARDQLGWQAKIGFKELVRIMIDADFRKLNLTPPGEGDRILNAKFPDRWWKTD